MPVMTLLRRAALPMAALLTVTSCSAVTGLQNTFFGGGSADAGRVKGFLGAVVADEPTAALAGREVLALGGSAADAAVAIGFTLAVTYPSRASLGAGGACLAYNPKRTGPGGGVPEAIVFTPVAPSAVLPRTDRPAAIPMMARGLFALHARYGRRPFETLVVPAEQLARFGTRASRAFVRDLSLVAGPVMADPNARAVFAPNGVPLTEGATMTQPDLGGTLSQIRTVGVGDLYQGALGRRFEEASALAGGGMTVADMRAALPKTLSPIVVAAGSDSVAFLPPPADGGLAAAAAFQALQQSPNAQQAANDRGLAVAAAWRAGGVDAAALLASAAPAAAPLPSLPASTSFATLDRDGNAVVCAVTMDNLFGTGRIAPGTGVVLAASPASAPTPLLAAAMVWNTNVRAFRAEAGGTGQSGAPLAVAVGLQNALRNGAAMPVPVPDPGRANVISCSQYLPGTEGSCTWANDPRESGLAVGSN